MNSPTSYRHEHIYLGANHDRNTRRTLWVVVLTAVMMVAEIAVGYFTGSMALLADGFHMATHTGALAIAAGAYVFARRHAHDGRFSFGTGKVGDLAGFASALVLAVIAVGIGGESLWRLASPTVVDFGEAIPIAVVGLIVNIASALLLMDGHHGHGHGHDHSQARAAAHTHRGHAQHHDHGHEDHHGHHHDGHDNNLRSAYLHVVADALTSVLAIAALLAGLYLGWTWLDPVMGVVGAAVIANWSYSLLRTSAAVLLDVTDAQVAERIQQALEGEPVQIEDLHVWRIGPAARAAIVSVSTSAAITEAQLRGKLAAVNELRHLTLEMRQAG